MHPVEVAGKDCKDDKYGQDGKYYDYAIRDAAECLTRAEQIKADSKLMPYVAKCVKEDLKAAKKAVSSIQDIRDIAQSKKDEDYEDDEKES